MEKYRHERYSKTSKDSNSSKSSKDFKEVNEKRECKEAKENEKKRDARDSKRSKDIKEVTGEDRRDRDGRRERDGREEREERREHHARNERKTKYEHEERRAEHSEPHDRNEHGKRGERESRRDRHSKTECQSKDEHGSKRHHKSKSQSESRSDREREAKQEHSKCTREVKEDKSGRSTKDKKDVKEVKRDKEGKDNTKTPMQNIKELIMRALECELGGHLLEARLLYEESLAKLESYSTQEKNEEISESYRKYLNSYERHVKQLRDKIEQSLFACKIIEHIAIPEGVRGRSFQKLFGCYLNEKVSLVHIYEPCLTQSTELEHLINFVELLVKNCPNLMFVRIITRASPKSIKLQSEVLHDLREELEVGSISFNYQFDEQLTKPRIIFDTGVVIRCGRGLHIYKPVKKYYQLGLYDYDFRRCESCEFDVYQGKPFSEKISKGDRTDIMESLLHA